MKTMFYKFITYWKMIFRIILTSGNKILVMCPATNSNLGDQAQLLCIRKWCKENFPDSKYIEIGDFGESISFYYGKFSLFTILACMIKLCCLKLKVKHNDIFLGHSGYFMTDHHPGWKMFINMMKFFPKNKMIIFPQTINFYNPYISKIIANRFACSCNVTLLCRDRVSYINAKALFPNTNLLLYPDIVTSLIGSKQFSLNREGVLFCIRDDV